MQAGDASTANTILAFLILWIGSVALVSIAQLRDYTTLVRQGRATLKDGRALLAAHQVAIGDNIGRWTEAPASIDAEIEFYDEWVSKRQRPASAPRRRIVEAGTQGERCSPVEGQARCKACVAAPTRPSPIFTRLGCGFSSWAAGKRRRDADR
jgi:hypothetical protein